MWLPSGALGDDGRGMHGRGRHGRGRHGRGGPSLSSAAASMPTHQPSRRGRSIGPAGALLRRGRTSDGADEPVQRDTYSRHGRAAAPAHQKQP